MSQQLPAPNSPLPAPRSPLSTRIKLTLAFDGTNYHGWQVQANAVTVQETLQDAAQKVFGFRPGISGCSRTDSGVHANMYCCHLDADHTLRIRCADEKDENQSGCRMPDAGFAWLVPAFNRVLPRDIAVLSCEAAPCGFHARYSCTGKTYVYKIYNAPVRSPFYEGYALYVRRPLDMDRMNRLAGEFCGQHDFSAFCSQKSDVADKTRTVTSATVRREGFEVLFAVSADGFLYNMARIMAGTLLGLERRQAPPGAIRGILESGTRQSAGQTAPARGLYLAEVRYNSQ
jgi:tRNA pseudouridine38-40 synthase